MTLEGIDPRTQIAINDLINYSGVLKIHKSTRSGATTSFCIACLLMETKFLVLEPTNKIIKETVIKDVKKYGEMPDAKIIHVPANFECKFNKDKIKENSDYKKLPSLPIDDNCKECGFYNTCPITEILRVEDFDGVVITYDKLIAIKRAAELYPESKASEIMEKISGVKVVILDEAHELAFPDIASMEFIEKPDNISDLVNKIKKINKENRKRNNNHKKFPIVETIVKKYLTILKDPDLLEKRKKLYNYFEDKHAEWYEMKHAAKVKNTNYKEYIVKKWVKNRRTNSYESFNIDESNVFGFLTEEIMNIMDHRIYSKYDIDIDDLVSIYNMLNFVVAKDINVKIFKKYDPEIEWKYELLTNLEANNLNFKKDLAEFIQSMQGYNRQIIITSATFPKYDFMDLFHYDTLIQNVMFGENGDPMNANSKMAIFCDSKRYHAFGRNSIKNNIEEIIKECNNVMDIFGSENCLIVCKNIIESKLFETMYEKIEIEPEEEPKYDPEISYYRSADLIGVRSNYRVMILIGLGYIPSDAYDSAIDNPYQSKVLAEEKMHCDSWQAISRAKDPEGKEPSVVIGIGCNKYEIDCVVSWGEGRGNDSGEPENGKPTPKQVTVSGAKITKPNVYDTKDWNETLIQSQIHMFGLKKTKSIEGYKCNNLLNCVKDEIIINSKAELFNTVFSESKYPTQYKYINRTFSKKDVPMDPEIISEHLSGSKNVYFMPAYKGSTNVIMIETKSDLYLAKFKIFFENNNINHVFEKLDDTFRIWMFIKKSKIVKAGTFAYEILDKLNIDKNSPDYTLDFDELIKMPFGSNSVIMIDGEFVKEFDELRISIVDIMENNLYKDLDPTNKLNFTSNANDSTENEGACY